ncbi:GNAT family N-acetyltransferase [Desertihabitans aurantiacus]|uniref:GNAT family N-acetyltransferase n=1 Tax=Desertihabitans aurantiacus TaxID=2282477 RepID=UPI0018E51472|nr:GNAT family N-acetyltransferase [Desertihabitans aurantiacus]
MIDTQVSVHDPRSAEVRELLGQHLAFTALHSPPEDVHALDVDALRGPGITFYGLRCDGRLAAVGALRRLSAAHAELKSMHTRAELRGRGLARRLLDALVERAVADGCTRVSLETGTAAAFAPARALYTSAGFRPCGPFGGYRPSPHSTFLSRVVG